MMSPLQENQPLDLVICSRDGGIGLRLMLYQGLYPIPNRIVVGSYFAFALAGGAGTGRVAVLFSDHFQFSVPKTFGLAEQMDRETFRIECAYAAIGEYLDARGLLPQTGPQDDATKLECFDQQFGMWAARSSADDDELLNYVRAKVYWCWRFDLDLASFTSADCLRWHTTVRTLKRIAQIEEGELWTMVGGNDLSLMLKPLPAFVRQERERRRQPNVTSSIPIDRLLSAPRYDGPALHWQKAQDFLIAEQPDLANAAKEAVCAIEGLARVVTGVHTETLGELVKRLKGQYNVNPAMAKSLEGMWGFVSNSPGVRHGGATPANIEEGEARYVVDSCEAAIRFLLGLDR